MTRKERAAEREEKKHHHHQSQKNQTNLDDDEPGVIVHAETRLHEAAAACSVVCEFERGTERVKGSSVVDVVVSSSSKVGINAPTLTLQVLSSSFSLSSSSTSLTERFLEHEPRHLGDEVMRRARRGAELVSHLSVNGRVRR